MRRVAGGFMMLAVLAALAGCGGDDGSGREPPPSPSQPPSGSPSAAPSGSQSVSRPGSPSPARTTITMTRMGGFAGVDHRLTVAPDGTWTYTADGKRETGRLTGRQVEKLWSLATDGRLPAEAKHRDKRICADGYGYDLTAGSFSMTAVECGQFEDRPAFTALVDFLKATTPL